jgi:hypothetical protein
MALLSIGPPIYITLWAQPPTDHPFNSCIREVFEELLDLLTAKQEELRRHERSGGATLHIGTTQE